MDVHARLLLLRRLDSVDELVACAALLHDAPRPRCEEDGVPRRRAALRRPAAVLLSRNVRARVSAGAFRCGDERRLRAPLPGRAAVRDDGARGRGDVLRDDELARRELQRGGVGCGERTVSPARRESVRAREAGRSPRRDRHCRNRRRRARLPHAVCAGRGRSLQPLQQGLWRSAAAHSASAAWRAARAPHLQARRHVWTRLRCGVRTRSFCGGRTLGVPARYGLGVSHHGCGDDRRACARLAALAG